MPFFFFKCKRNRTENWNVVGTGSDARLKRMAVNLGMFSTLPRGIVSVLYDFFVHVVRVAPALGLVAVLVRYVVVARLLVVVQEFLVSDFRAG